MLLAACSLDSSGFGSTAGSVGSADSRGTSESSDGGESSSSTAPGTSEAQESTGAPESTTQPATSDGTTTEPQPTSDDGHDPTTDADPCSAPPPFTLELGADEAVLSGTMALGVLFDGTTYVYGEIAEDGTATFDVELPCGDDYMVWAEVFDAEPGPLDLPLYTSDPGDALRVEIGGVVTQWSYGCQWDVFDAWARLAVSTSPDCITNDKVVMSLVGGQHTLTIAALEGGEHTGGLSPGSVAAFARVFITNDLENSP